MENKEFEFKGGSMNGFLMCLIDILLFFGACGAFGLGVVSEDWPGFALFVVLIIAFIFCTKGLTMLEPNEAKVLTFFGKYGDKLNLKKFMAYSGALCVVCYILASASSNPIVGLVGCILCGFSVAIMWPGTISISSKNCLV